MKSLTTLLQAHVTRGQQRSNFRILVMLLAVLAAIVVLFSFVFHLLMAREGQEHSWLTGFYWTIVAMSTLGFGDITFTSDLGRMFSVLVVVTGTMLMLIILPFTFIQFFYAPWLEARDAARAPWKLPPTLRGHVLLTGYGALEDTLAQRLRRLRTPFTVIVPDLQEALNLDAAGVPVMVGDHDDPETYVHAQIDQAALVVAARTDPENASIAATVRERSNTVKIVALASSEDSAEILKLAGCEQVIQLGELLGASMARRVFGRDGRSHVIGQIGQLVVAEAGAAGTPLVGKAVRDSGLRARFNLNIAGLWSRGHFILARPETIITADSVLLLTGTRSQLDAYDATFQTGNDKPASAVLLGGGRVGRAAATALSQRGVDYRIVEKNQSKVFDPAKTIVGDAADRDALNLAGIQTADSVLVTTHDDAVNVYLTLYVRRLRPDVLILSRATLERNATTLHRVGADYVFSSTSMAANTVLNMLGTRKRLFLAEGLDVFTTPVPKPLVGRTLADSHIRQNTGCNVLAVLTNGQTTGHLDISTSLPADAELILIGDREAEERFFERYPA
jgi:Trk K+ transport system NAD-binding subunit